MEYQHLHYCFTMSDEQVKFLRSKKYKIDRMECFMSLVTLAERDTRLVPVSKIQQIELLPGQFMVDNTQLAKLWDKDRKTVPKILEAMEELGISSSQKIGDNRIHTLHALSGWYINGKFKGNDFAQKRNSSSPVISHVEVPPARVITIEDDVATDKKEESLPNDTDNSGTAPMDKVLSADGIIQPNTMSNDIVASEGVSSEKRTSSDTSFSGTFSPVNSNNYHSDGHTSSPEEAAGKQNEGKWE